MPKEESAEYDADDVWHHGIGWEKWATETTNDKIWAETAYGCMRRGATPGDNVEIEKGDFRKADCYISMGDREFDPRIDEAFCGIYH